LPSNWIKELIADAAARGTRLDWVNCGLCVDERGVNDAVGGTRRGSPVDLWKMAQASDNVLVIATK
jgi:tRNA 2-thiouridine synthesizing protein D